MRARGRLHVAGGTCMLLPMKKGMRGFDSWPCALGLHCALGGLGMLSPSPPSQLLLVLPKLLPSPPVLLPWYRLRLLCCCLHHPCCFLRQPCCCLHRPCRTPGGAAPLDAWQGLRHLSYSLVDQYGCEVHARICLMLLWLQQKGCKLVTKSSKSRQGACALLKQKGGPGRKQV